MLRDINKNYFIFWGNCLFQWKYEENIFWPTWYTTCPAVIGNVHADRAQLNLATFLNSTTEWHLRMLAYVETHFQKNRSTAKIDSRFLWFVFMYFTTFCFSFYIFSFKLIKLNAIHIWSRRQKWKHIELQKLAILFFFFLLFFN